MRCVLHGDLPGKSVSQGRILTSQGKWGERASLLSVNQHTVLSVWSVAFPQRRCPATRPVLSEPRRRGHATVSIWRSLKRWQRHHLRHFSRSETSAQYGTNLKYTPESHTQGGGRPPLPSNSSPHQPVLSPALPAISPAFWPR